MLVSVLLLAAQVAPSQPAAAPAEDKRMCRIIQEAHSRIGTRVCRKQSEWDQLERDTQEDLRASRNQRTNVPN